MGHGFATVRRCLVVGIIAILAVFPGARAQQALVTVHVPSKPLAEALIDFAIQARLSISISGVDFHNAVSNPVDGRYSQADALNRLVRGSGFEFVSCIPVLSR